MCAPTDMCIYMGVPCSHRTYTYARGTGQPQAIRVCSSHPPPPLLTPVCRRLSFSIGVYPGLESDGSYLRSVGVLSGGCVSLLGLSAGRHTSIYELNAADESIGLGLVSPFSVFFLGRRVSFSPFSVHQNPFGLADYSRGPSASS